jgi:hypothetical protein
MAAPVTYFPDESVEFHFTMGLNFGVAVTRFSNGRRQARKTVEKVLRSLEGRIPTTTLTKSESVRAFLTNRFGPLETFYIYAWPFQKFTAFAVGTGNDVQLDFPVPFLFGATITNILVDGVAAEGSHTVSFGQVPISGAHFIRIESPPVGGDEDIVADIIGREQIPVELVGNVVRIEHPLRRPQSSAETGAADYYSLPVMEVP